MVPARTGAATRCARDILRPHRARKSVRRGVRCFDRFLFGVEGEHGKDRTEDFFAGDRGGRRDAVEDRGGIIEFARRAQCLGAAAAAGDARTARGGTTVPYGSGECNSDGWSEPVSRRRAACPPTGVEFEHLRYFGDLAARVAYRLARGEHLELGERIGVCAHETRHVP